MKVLTLFEGIIGILCFTSAAFANNLSWSDCLKKAQANNLTIQSSQHTLESSQYNLKASYFKLLPDLKLSSSYYRSEDNNRYDIAYTVSLELPTLKDYYSVRGSKISLLKAKQNYSIEERNLKASLAKAFIDLALSHKELLLRKSIVKRMEQNKRLSEIRFKSGDASTPKFNVQEQEQRYLRALAQLNQTQKNVELNNQKLKDLLLDSSTTMYQPNVESLIISIPSKEVVLSKIEDHPDIKVSKINVQEAELKYKEVRSDFLPTLSVSSSYTRSKTFDIKSDNDYIKDGWMIQATITLPILSSIETYARTQSFNELYKGSKLNLDQERLTLKQNIKLAYSKYENSLSDLDLVQKDLNIQKSKANIYQKRYEMGKISYDDWSDSQEKLTNAEISVITAEQNKYMNLINLKNTIGE